MKKIKIFLILLVLFISISTVSAEGNFTALQKEIDSSTDSLDITQDYMYDNITDYAINDGILLNKSNFVINGNGHTIDASNQSRIFNITGNNISIFNLNFINAYSSANGGAIYSNGNLNLINCVFENNTANNGGAVYFSKEFHDNLITSTFIGNNAKRAGGAIYIRGLANNNTFISEFYNNNAFKASGGGIFFLRTAENNTFECIFTNNSGAYGAGMFFYRNSNKNIFNCDFRSNIASSCGGAMFFYSKSNYNVFKGHYINNAAYGLVSIENGNGGAITFKNTSTNSIFNCDFINNSARLFGGAVNFRVTPYNITFNSNFIHNRAGYGGGVNFFDTFYNVSFNGDFIDNNAEYGGAIAMGNGEIANILFSNNSAKNGGAIYFDTFGQIKDCNFTNNVAENGGAIYNNNTANITGCYFISNTAIWGGNIFSKEELNVDYSIFSNSTSTYAPAVYAENNLKIINSFFHNLTAFETAGAIGIKGENYTEINNSTFINTKASKNGGALYVDTLNYTMRLGITFIVNSSFIESSGDFGGALVKLGGILSIENTKFINNTALYDGGAIYTSWTESNIKNTTIIGNQILYDGGFGGGLYLDYSNTTVEDCYIRDNNKQGIYAYDKLLSVKNTVFSNNGEAIYGVFLDYDIRNITVLNDTLFLNDTDYSSIVSKIGKTLELVNNSIDVKTLPSLYDSRDWGWVSSVKNQGEMGACWTFASLGALESALIKATGIEYDFSENNMQNAMLKYSKYGINILHEGAFPETGLEYLISWLGVIPQELDTYDELGKISPLISSNDSIHIQDAIIVKPRANASDNDGIKKAIIKCGSVSMTYFHDEMYYSEDNATYYQNIETVSSHAVSFVGWDDNFPASKFKITPPGNGAWIVKDSYGTEFGESGYFYLSYYDTSILNPVAVGFLIENIENYTTNYQTDLGGMHNPSESNGSVISYKNTYDSLGNELISAIGTYFDEDENYIFEIYVNNKLMHSQSGIAPFSGYHTVKLTTEIPISSNDYFTVIMNKSYVPILGDSRQHYLKNVSFINDGNGWTDLALENKTVSLKVYTKDLAIYTQDLVKIFKNESKFEANIGVANETVTFEINGGTYNRTSDENGTAKLAVNLNPGNYTIKTTFNGTAVQNSIHVLPTLIGDNLVKYFRNESQFYISLIDGEGNPVVGKNITMNINGVFYNRTTNENGTARLNINLNPGEYILTAIDPLTGLMMSYNITVLPVLTADDINMTYDDGTQFKAKLVDGQGKALENAAVTFNINGVFYTRYTNSSGIAGLNIKLMSGEYIITSQYENAVISNKITISAKED